MNNATKEIYIDGKVTSKHSEIYNDLLKSEQNSYSPMLNLPPTLCTGTSTSQNSCNIIIGSGCDSDICLDDMMREFLAFLKTFSVH